MTPPDGGYGVGVTVEERRCDQPRDVLKTVHPKSTLSRVAWAMDSNWRTMAALRMRFSAHNADQPHSTR